MTKKSLSVLKGVYAATCTPFREDLSINYAALAKHCGELLTRGCAGIVLFGTTGEGSSIPVYERGKALQKIVELGVDPSKMILGVICSSIEEAAKLSQQALRYKCAGVLIAPPFYFKNVTEAGVMAFYRDVIRKVNHPDLRVLLYHIPKYSGVAITLNTIKTLCHEFPDNIVGIKESDGNIPFIKEILESNPGFQVFSGKEIHIAESVRLGGSGGISGLANAYPELISSLCRQAPDRTEEVLKNIQAIHDLPTFPAIKHMLRQQKGADWQAIRPPLMPLDKNQSQELDRRLHLL